VTASSRRRGVALAVLGLVALFAVAIVAERLRDEERPPDPQLSVGRPLPLPAAALGSSRSLITTDGDLPQDDAPVWVFDRVRDGRRAVRQLTPSSDRVVVAQRTSVRADADEPRTTRFAVGRWTGGENAAFRMVPRSSGVEVRVVTLDGRSRQLSRGTARTAPVPGADRELAVATWERGKLPALFVIDHGLPRERVTVAVFSGESAFRKRVATFKLPIRGLPREDWILGIARGIGNRPNLVAIARAGRSKHPEVHVISGDADFQKFVAQYPIALPPLARDTLVRPGSVLGRPALYLIDRDGEEFRAAEYAGSPLGAIEPPA
jgi:hypothetical protein